MPWRHQFESNEEYNEWYRNYRSKNIEKRRAYGREYNKQWRYKYGYHSERKWKNKNPEKIRAERLAQYALKIGYLLERPCEKCDNEKVQMHHDDYTKPLKVRWLCPVCHRNEHIHNSSTNLKK